MPRLLLHVGHLFTVEELRKAADLVVHHAAGVLAGAAQRAQEQLTLFGVTSQLRQRTEMTHIQQCEGGGVTNRPDGVYCCVFLLRLRLRPSNMND